LRARILSDKKADATSGNGIYGFRSQDDLFRSFLHDAAYHWGSNNPRANYGNTNLDAITYRISPPDDAGYRMRALETVHYFHGVNPFAMVYLSNMASVGASNSASKIYHAWFQPGSRWGDARKDACGPAPGYVPGGPNVNAARDGVPVKLAPPTGQPPQKSYRDWNADWPENSWSVTEPAIYYQAAYIRLLSAFVP
jgi:hypothetical protein